MSMFAPAVKHQRPLRASISGTPGSGKTWSALAIMTALVGAEGKVAVIDTERASSSLYSDHFKFDKADLCNYSVNDYVTLIEDCGKSGYKGLIIDSISHAWDSTGGLLERVKEVSMEKNYKLEMKAWGDVAPEERRLWDAILDFPGHIIVTMRSKIEYAIGRDERSGKAKVEKLGMSPIQRSGKEYEFDIVAEIDELHILRITKTRCPELANQCFEKPGEDLGNQLAAWLGSGTPAPLTKAQAREKLGATCRAKGWERENVKAWALKELNTDINDMEAQAIEKLIEELEDRYEEPAGTTE